MDYVRDVLSQLPNFQILETPPAGRLLSNMPVLWFKATLDAKTICECGFNLHLESGHNGG